MPRFWFKGGVRLIGAIELGWVEMLNSVLSGFRVLRVWV